MMANQPVVFYVTNGVDKFTTPLANLEVVTHPCSTAIPTAGTPYAQTITAWEKLDTNGSIIAHEPADLVPIEIDLAAEGVISFTPPAGCTVDYISLTATTSTNTPITQSDVDTHFDAPNGLTLTINSPLTMDPATWLSGTKIFIKATSTTGTGYFDDTPLEVVSLGIQAHPCVALTVEQVSSPHVITM